MQMQPKVGQFRYYPSVGSLNTYLTNMLEKIRVELPDIQRISFALYDEKKDSIKTCADSSPVSHDFVHYELPLANLPSLQQSKESEHCALFTISRIKPKAIHLITAGCWNSNIALR